MKIQLLSNGARVPQKANAHAAGYDLYVPKDSIIHPGRNVILLDIKIALDEGTFGDVKSRSGFAAKGMVAKKCDADGNIINPKTVRINADVVRGTIDEDYRGNIGVIIHNKDNSYYLIEQGTRIAQLIIQRYENSVFEIVEVLNDTSRGDDGFGSTGIK